MAFNAISQLGFAQGQLAAQEMENKRRKLDLEAGELDFKFGGLDIQRRKFFAEQAQQKLEQLGASMKMLGEAAKALGPQFKPGGPLDKAVELVKGNLAKALELNGLDPNLAQAAADMVRAQAEIPADTDKLKTARGLEAILGRKPTEAEILQVVGGASAGTIIEVPGELGTTRIQVGGTIPQPGATQVGATGQGAAQPQAGSIPTTPPGQGGKPLPREAQDNLTGAFGTLTALRTMAENIDKTGLLQGLASEVGAFFGTDKGAVDFNVARQNLKVQAQAIIKGIPSNFDVQTFIETLPKLVEATPKAKSKIAFTAAVTEQLIRDTVAYYKFTGFRIPPEVVAQANSFGIDLNTVPAWDGKGTATKNAERMLKGEEESGAIKEGATATNPKTGERIIFKGGKWQPLK